jgi:phosphatidate cytidylyltransferase
VDRPGGFECAGTRIVGDVLKHLVGDRARIVGLLAGRRFGKHKLAPRISPGKTAEGLAGAYIAVSAYAVIALRIYQPDAAWPAYMALLVFGFILTSLSVTGDLFESLVKRRAGAKDSGDLLPGHGGVLDRIDSVTATIPFAVLFFAGMLV